MADHCRHSKARSWSRTNPLNSVGKLRMSELPQVHPETLPVSLRWIVSARPRRGGEGLLVIGLESLEVRRVVATELIDGGVELEVDLVEPADEGDGQVISVSPPLQT